MEAYSCREGVEGVGEPLIKLVWRGGERGGRDAEAFDRVFQVVPANS